MKNIIKSQFYVLRKHKLIFITAFLLIALWASISFMVWDMNNYPANDSQYHTYGSEFFAITLSMIAPFSLVFIFTAVPIMAGSDFSDKTTNYELMTGHMRWEIYFGRLIPCIIVGVVGWVIIVSSGFALITILAGGWGDKIPLSQAILRIAIMCLPVIRIICEMFVVTIIIKKPFFSVLLGWMVFILTNVVMQYKGAAWFGISEIYALTYIDSWVTYGISDESSNFLYDATLPVNDIVITVIFSIVITAATLALGYYFFKKDDLN